MKKIQLIFFFFLSFFAFSQVNKNDTLRVENHPKDSIKAGKSDVEVFADIEKANAPKEISKLNPVRAGLYSAVLPGLGQYYNKKIWKIPIVWGAIGTGVGITLYNNKQYKRYRNAFIAQLNGQQHEFSHLANSGIDLKTALGNQQDYAKRMRDYSIAITAGIYILNIIDAVVDAHLYEQRRDPDLSLNPAIVNDGFGLGFSKPGLSLNYKF